MGPTNVFQDSLQNWINQLRLYPCVCRALKIIMRPSLWLCPVRCISTPPPHMRWLSHNCHNYEFTIPQWLNTSNLSTPFGLVMCSLVVVCELHGFIVLSIVCGHANVKFQFKFPTGDPYNHNIAQCGVLGRCKCKCSVTSISRLQSEGAVSGPAPRCVFSIYNCWY